MEEPVAKEESTREISAEAKIGHIVPFDDHFSHL